jgi:hypothetical protein
MVIEFLCPNGHKIHCPDDRAGKPAKCPKCAAKFRVPIPEPEVEEEEGEEAEEKEDGGSQEDEVTSPTAEEQIEFLCPNGHRLHGPASLQGKAGECPECGSRFRVPSYDEVPDVEEQEPEQQISVADSEDMVTLQEAQAEDSGVGAVRVAGGSGASSSSVGLAGPSTVGPRPHPLAGLVARLWAAKPEEAVVELQLTSGEKIIPQRFFKSSSTGSHGLFAVEEDDGTYTLIATSWDSVQRVLVRSLKQLPESLRE